MTDWNQTKTKVLAENTAQGVYKHLRTLKSNRARFLPRWIWELLQNARDVSGGSGSLVASLELSDTELTFSHNGRGFEPEDIAHLIYYGSTKIERDDALGQFGSGFLTTHLLSLTIDVSGRLTDGNEFEFRLDRGGDSIADLQKRMEHAYGEFQSSLDSEGDRCVPGTTATFRYPIDEHAQGAVQNGLEALELTGPHVAAVNPEFRRIRIQRPATEIAFEVKETRKLGAHIKEVQVEVSAQNSGPQGSRNLLLAESDGTAVVVPIQRTGENVALASSEDLPKLLLGFPLIGTEDFSFPAVVHCLHFSPTEDRDGIFFGQSDDCANRKNQDAIRQACGLALRIGQFATESAWTGAHRLAKVPTVQPKSWLNTETLRDCLKVNLVDPMREARVVLTDTGSGIAPRASTLPVADGPDAVDELWSLSHALTSLKGTLPRRADAPGWCEAAGSWAELENISVDQIEETLDGSALADHVEKAGTIETLQADLVNNDATSWLDNLHAFLHTHGFRDKPRTSEIVPDQNGRFNKLTELHRDQDIPGELKEIASLIGWDIRAELRDSRLQALADELGKGDLDRDRVVGQLIQRLSRRMEESLDTAAKDASVRLFRYLASHGQWDYLKGFPAFSAAETAKAFIELVRHEADVPQRPLAPVPTWPEPLRRYADLFPRRRVLADDFAVGLDDPSVWSALDERGFLRSNVVHKRTEQLDEFLPDEPLPEPPDNVKHEVDGTVEVSDVAFLKGDSGILDGLRRNQKKAGLFWEFLTEWLAVEDTHGLEAQRATCQCGSSHAYYPAVWLVPLVRNQWVPLEEQRSDWASARSLAALIGRSGTPTTTLTKRPEVGALLKALRVSMPDLIKWLVTEGEDQREELDKALAQLLTSVGGDRSRLQVLVGDIEDDEHLFNHLEERRTRRRIVRENQRLGALIEDLVKENLEKEGFEVRRTGVGSDFEIQPDPAAEGEQIGLELTRDGRTWLVEIKSAHDDSVRMTAVQARTAVQHDSNYLLCVVPLSAGSGDPDIEAVRTQMRFIQGIGARLAVICTDLDEFEDLREIVTAEGAAGVQLELDSGSPRIRVGCAVWEVGFGLDSLLSRLTAPTL